MLRLNLASLYVTTQLRDHELPRLDYGRVALQNYIFVCQCGMRHLVGCRVCGAKSSSRFREWRSYSELEGF